MAAVSTYVFVVLLVVISVNFSVGKLYRTHSLPVCAEGRGLAVEEATKEVVCRPYCAVGHLDIDGNKELCLDVGAPPVVGGEHEEHIKKGHHVKVSDFSGYVVEDKRYLMEKPLEDDIKKCNQTMTDTRACVAREIACHAKENKHCLIWRRAAYIFCSKTFCGNTYFRDCLLSHVLDDGEIVHTNSTHVSTGGWESFREHEVHYQHGEIGADLARLDTGDDSICQDETAPAIPLCNWSMMLASCPDKEEEDHGDHDGNGGDEDEEEDDH